MEVGCDEPAARLDVRDDRRARRDAIIDSRSSGRSELVGDCEEMQDAFVEPPVAAIEVIASRSHHA